MGTWSLWVIYEASESPTHGEVLTCCDETVSPNEGLGFRAYLKYMIHRNRPMGVVKIYD